MAAVVYTLGDKDFIDDVHRVIYKSCSSMRILTTLAMGENQKMADELGLANALGISYSKCAHPAVLEFAMGFDEHTDIVEFRGKSLQFSQEMLREAFNLPPEEAFSPWKSKWESPVLRKMFTKEQSSFNPYSSTWFTPSFKHWVDVIRLVQKILLGKSKPTQLPTKDIWYYWAHWWQRIPRSIRGKEKRPTEMPDWGHLMFDHLKREILALRSHVLAVREDPKRKKLSCYCGVAVTRILSHLGYSEYELRNPVLPGEQTRDTTCTFNRGEDSNSKSLQRAAATTSEETQSIPEMLKSFCLKLEVEFAKKEITWKGKEKDWMEKETRWKRKEENWQMAQEEWKEKEARWKTGQEEWKEKEVRWKTAQEEWKEKEEKEKWQAARAQEEWQVKEENHLCSMDNRRHWGFR